MTLHEVAHQLYTICSPVPCYINDVKRTSEADVRNLLSTWLRGEHSQFICQYALPDGRWYIKLTRDGQYYDYYIPDTREQEKRLIAELFR